ncbi:ABC transporter permease [Candidatus Parcubacteria bacterium]|nr:MAG: ABC transporter permease [Candidatus Parcubacteria bacterium]
MFSALNPKWNLLAFRELLSLLTKHRELTWELTRREIRERYSGQVFGTLWAIGHPLALTLVYVFIFAFVFRMRVGGSLDMPLDYTAYMLSGLIPWLTMQESMGKASTTITANAHIVKQVIFPLEVLPVKSVLATLVSEAVFLVLLAVYTLVTSHTLLWTYALLPLLVLFQVFLMIGIGYLLSSIGAFFRDIKDFVQVFLSIAFFILPILYLPEAVPVAVRYILYINPFSYMIWVFQDVLYFGRFAHPWAWWVFGVGSLALFIIGYRVFRKLKVMFGNVL